MTLSLYGTTLRRLEGRIFKLLFDHHAKREDPRTHTLIIHYSRPYENLRVIKGPLAVLAFYELPVQQLRG